MIASTSALADVQKEAAVDTGSGAADARVRAALSGLGDEYRIFYRPQISRRDEVDPLDRTLDFVIAHRTKGLLAVSIKSGEVSEEPNGVITQFQPGRNVYKIMDPATQARSALNDLLAAGEAGWRDTLPMGAAVFLPDTRLGEFFDPKNVFFFHEDLEGDHIRAKLDVLFPYPFEASVKARFESAFEPLCAFLKQHGMADDPIVDRREQILQFTETSRKKPFIISEGLRAPASPDEGQAPSAAEPEAKKPIPQVEAELVVPAVDEVEKAASALKAAKAAARGRVRPAQTAPLLAFFQELESGLQFPETRVVLSAGQWAVAALAAVGLICAAYFGFHNLGVALQL